MFINSVETTLLLLCTDVTACFASSFTVTIVAAIPSPPDATSILLLRLFFAIGFFVGFVAKAFRCCGRACLRRHARQVQGTVRRRKGLNTLKPDIMRAYLQEYSIET